MIEDFFGFKDSVYEEMCQLVKKYYHQEIDYFDLRNKQELLHKIAVHLIYDKDDETVPFDRGTELNAALSFSQLTQTSGLGHYKILSSPEVIEHVRLILHQ